MQLLMTATTKTSTVMMRMMMMMMMMMMDFHDPSEPCLELVPLEQHLAPARGDAV
jgi:hypothetical protein